MQPMLDQILDRAPTGIVCLDPAARITFANPAALRLMGCTDAEELIGQPIRTYIQFLTLGTSGEDFCFRDDGTSFPIEYETAPMLEGRDAIGTVITFRDITSRRAADRRKDELISIVSHELRTPLTSVRAALGLLAGGMLGRLTDRGQAVVDTAVGNADRLIRLITNMLDMERVRSGQVRMERVPCSASELMTQAADSVRGLADAAGVRLEVSSAEVGVLGDPDRLLQVLINLVSNAIKFSPPGGGSVWLDAEQTGDEVLFRVRDEGRGIPPDKLETIFERFAQVEAADSREKGGTGLGLAICRAIVDQHGGHIWAESTWGAGTTLCVALPSVEIQRAELERAA